ncbi:hypothetical protein TRIUR3_17070 [Triticum urartu]|uniref:Uncharacterized protein n=1 Tax=Triticum urartu TaxID=4572 RepID=M7ZK89_TRIUA|nr:hypothetical protein TRIUR3_17070 [Triticum urartu]
MCLHSLRHEQEQEFAHIEAPRKKTFKGMLVLINDQLYKIRLAEFERVARALANKGKGWSVRVEVHARPSPPVGRGRLSARDGAVASRSIRAAATPERFFATRRMMMTDWPVMEVLMASEPIPRGHCLVVPTVQQAPHSPSSCITRCLADCRVSHHSMNVIGDIDLSDTRRLREFSR